MTEQEPNVRRGVKPWQLAVWAVLAVLAWAVVIGAVWWLQWALRWWLSWWLS